MADAATPGRDDTTASGRLLRTYTILTGREQRRRRVVRLGDWLHYVPYNGKRRLIVHAFGRTLLLHDGKFTNRRRAR